MEEFVPAALEYFRPSDNVRDERFPLLLRQPLAALHTLSCELSFGCGGGSLGIERLFCRCFGCDEVEQLVTGLPRNKHR